MKLALLLSQKKPVILERWRRLIFDSYPPESAIFLRKEKDRFDNPVGFYISRGLAGLYEALLKEMDTTRFMASLDEILRIKAIQDLNPSQALAFIFLLKNVIREELRDELREDHLSQELLELESRIDGMALLGFDVYVRCREKLHEVRLNEVKNRVSGLLRRTGLSLNNL